MTIRPSSLCLFDFLFSVSAHSDDASDSREEKHSPIDGERGEEPMSHPIPREEKRKGDHTGKEKATGEQSAPEAALSRGFRGQKTAEKGTEKTDQMGEEGQKRRRVVLLIGEKGEQKQ